MIASHLIHLANRIGFGLSPSQFRILRDKTRREVVASFLDPVSNRARGRDVDDTEEAKMNALRAKWLRGASLPTAHVATERMVLFWHDHFACLPKRADLAEGYLNLIRDEALGNFRSLLLGMSTDAAMMRYLNATAIKRDNPNENFAREILELFTVGIDGYTERDVKELARAFAGWGINADQQFVLRKGQVDPGKKTILGTTGNFTGREALELVLRDRRTSRFLTRKLWVYLTDHEPTTKALQRHADVLYESNYEIKPWLRSMLEDDDFYATDLLGKRVKSPVDLLLGLCHNLGTTMPVDNDKFHNFARQTGEFLLAPPSVAGWPGGQAWLSSATLPARLAMTRVCVEGKLSAGEFAGDFAGLEGRFRAAAELVDRDPDLGVCMLGQAVPKATVVALGSHLNYQYG